VSQAISGHRKQVQALASTSGEQLMTLTELAKRTPGRPHSSTLWRWCRRGVNGVRLEYRKVGRRIFSSAQAMDRFTRAAAEAEPALDDPRKPVEGNADRPNLVPGHHAGLNRLASRGRKRRLPGTRPSAAFEKATAILDAARI
jgi:Protein of unknown function (DUF1580)